MTREPRDAPQFYLTAPSACPYLPDRLERKVFTHLIGRRAAAINDALTQSGFRDLRPSRIARPARCAGPASRWRVLVDEFETSRSFRRVAARNDDLVSYPVDAKPTTEQYSLFRAYLAARHGDGGMADMSILDFTMMVEDTHVQTKLVEYRRHGPDTAITKRGQGPLVAMSLTDMLADGLSMVYSFYDPEQFDRSLGTYMILDHIARAKALGLPPRLSRLLGRGLAQNGLQGALLTPATPWHERLGTLRLKAPVAVVLRAG